MKTTSKGFTLVEMLIVLLVIGILISILLPVVGSITRSGQNAKRKGEMQSIGLAIQGYFNDYGIFPRVNTKQADLTYAPEELFKILLGEDDTNNPKKKVYLETSGMRFQGNDPSTFILISPTKGRYMVQVDSDYDRIIDGNKSARARVWDEGKPTEQYILSGQ